MSALAIGICPECGADFYRGVDQHMHCRPCDAIIVLENVDEGGVEYRQPGGFHCLSCDAWSCDRCGNRADRLCASCIAYAMAGRIRAAARDLETAIYYERADEAFALLSALLALSEALAGQLMAGGICSGEQIESFRSRRQRVGTNGDARRERVPVPPTSNEQPKATTPFGDLLQSAPSGVEE